VVYLPGLGESSDSGQKWRGAWSAAGYAVLSVQALDEDARAWASDLARTGEFRALGRERFSAAATARRVQTIVELLDEAQRRAAAGEPGGPRVDWSRVAVAGFDLGAAAAMVLAGERVPGTEAWVGRRSIRAAIALSPHASIANGAFDTRWRDIRLPVLSVTSDSDGDALGLVDSVALRQAPFEHMQGPDKYLLALQGVSHAALAGNGAAADAHAAADARRTADAPARTDGDGNHRHGGRGKGAGDAGKPARAAPATEGRPAQLPDAGALPLRVIAAQDVSTAFLDAYVKDDPLAREWLARDAARWLGRSGALRSK